MRRYILLCISLLAAILVARAEKVSPQQAATVAERFLQAESPATKAMQGAVRLTGTWPQVQTKGVAEDPALYIFERDGGGYVVVAGDDVSQPVIGYSTSGRFPLDELPSNVRYMLDWHSSMIAYARTQGIQADATTKAQWLSAGNNGEAVLLETAHWNQYAPYNNLAPKLNGKDCPIGCVATALAIIMRYHQWPKKGTGSLPGYYWPEGGVRIEGYPLDHTYDWSQMPLKYENGQYTTEQGAQVAQLMYDLAVMVEMEFHTASSGAHAHYGLRLATYFGYDKQMRYEDWDYWKREEWEAMLRDEIDAGRPVYYGAFDASGNGHAIVVDGYKGAYFSLNYGWGSGSEFYLLRPTVPLDEDAVTRFCKMVTAISHIYPDRGGEVYANYVDDALVPFPWDFRSNSFPVGGRAIYDYYSTGTAALWLGFALYDRMGQFKQLASDSVLVSTDYPYMPELTCNITCSIEEGDQLMLSMRVDGHWEPITQSSNAYLVFHPGQKLSGLVSVGYSVGDPDDPEIPAAPCFSLRGAKDIYWEIWSEDLGVQLATSQSTYTAAEYGGQVFTMSAHWVRETDEYRSIFHYPAGNYRIFLRNFDEELTLYVKL